MPDDLALEIVFPEDLVQHHLDVMAGVPIAVKVKAAGPLQNTRQFHAAGPHEFDIRLGGFMAVVEGSLFLCFAPEDFVISVGVERRIDVDEIDAGIGQLL
jgi:hypothetical protein